MSVPACRAQVRRTDSRSSSCSGVKSMSTKGALLGSGLPGVAATTPGIVVGGGRDGDPRGAGGAEPVAGVHGQLERDPAAAVVVDTDVGDGAADRHRVAGE